MIYFNVKFPCQQFTFLNSPSFALLYYDADDLLQNPSVHNNIQEERVV